jgi:hypothetical protein
MSNDNRSPSERFMDLVSGNVQRMGQEIGAELKRLGVQGQMELASALFGGNAFVPYGPGQYTPSNDNQKGKEVDSPEVHEPQIEGHEQQQHRGRGM